MDSWLRHRRAKCVDDIKASVDALRTLTAQDAKVEVQGVACLVAVVK
ncbi:MAG: hypothetical protein IJ455_00020 [Agathobacter sp.]|nr:hypothetical protein [Agathobacter sp.]